MSASESKKKKATSKKSDEASAKFEEKASAEKAEESHDVDESLEPFLESNAHETRMTFDTGGFPLYVKAVWGVFLVSITYYLYVYALPDLTAWGAP